MPSKVPRPCRAAGCNGKTTERHGYCPEHEHMAVGWNERRKGKSGRGGRPWRRKREAVLQRDRYLCQPCQINGRATPATEVDHIKPVSEGGTDSMFNLVSVCRSCHQAKTQAESARAKS